MSTSRTPHEHAELASQAADWNEKFRGREIYRVAAGPNWLRLHLAGDDHMALLFTDLPGARLVFAQSGRLPDSLSSLLEREPKHPLQPLLVGQKIMGFGVLTDDKVFAIRMKLATGEAVLLSKLFGARGNFTLVDRKGHLLWSVHRPPHLSLAAWPSKNTWQPDHSTSLPPEYDQTALAQLTFACAETLYTRSWGKTSRLHKSASRLVKNLQRDLDNADQVDVHRQKAEALAANLHTMSRGESAIELASLDDGTPLAIKLDPARTPAENMDSWFRRTRKARKGLAIIQERHEAATQSLSDLTNAREELKNANLGHESVASRLDALQAWSEQHPELFKTTKRRQRGQTLEEPSRPFRRFLIDGVWEVWVGRNNKENDELTHRAAHNRDIWLHAQGVSGSHVVIRAGGQPERIPKNVLLKAAALAALHSKAKHAKHVPVIYTEKRYVRKPRKAPAGTAACLRDQSVFVEPGIGKGVETA
ncbi:MAG: hypothetical protein ACI9UK_001350 [Candidatus Krumholzibacteriia bacterium]|jgi:hypothetical protein